MIDELTLKLNNILNYFRFYFVELFGFLIRNFNNNNLRIIFIIVINRIPYISYECLSWSELLIAIFCSNTSIIGEKISYTVNESSVYGSVGQPKAYKPEVPGSTLGSSCFSLVFIKNLINDKSKHKINCYYLYCIVLGLSQLFITYTSL